ncbi:AAA family ATPase [Pseudomonas sp. PA15(2017)]|uniref:sigma 54-interacting transcriptional regulator n=1 Tax=Pseudomonas sp. PA15(2017) TaxID=1932111 RepID=UPI00096091DA|nr:sigma 54-interacting transcriptional regulator [Pseudomonas sp. PA15(2017)]OLU33668.1 AAA family ATPase [Pseudomonas sp. PA15(2017)]
MESALDLLVLENGISSLDVLGQSISELGIDVLLLGETGTGKDTVARHLHKLSRPKGPFVAVNCAAIPETLFESELFGVSAGAFTGADRDRSGYFEAAHRGTLYLDEIDSMPLNLQVKLLRVLESRQVERLGSTRAIPLDIGVVASAQRSLDLLMEGGLFRRDLYYRLSVMSLSLPPLRQRPSHVVSAFRHFVATAEVELNMPAPALDERVEELLLNHGWPGNYRELKSAARRHVLGMPLIDDDPDDSSETGLKNQLRLIEKTLIQQSLKRNDHCIAAVTSELDIPRRTLYQRMKDLDV